MKKIYLIFIFLCAFKTSFSTSFYGAKISARYISGFTFEITVTTFTKTSSIQGNLPSLDSVDFGDGNVEQFIRVSKVDLANDLSVNTYIKNHTYHGAGRFTVFYIGSNRDQIISNIPHSASVPFAVDMELVIDPNSCPASSPLFNCIPIFNIKDGKDFVASFSAYDLNRDSVSYNFIPCHGSSNLPIPGYSIPSGITLNAFSGEFKWPGNMMPLALPFCFAIQVDKWRNGINFGHATVDVELIIDQATDTNFNFTNTSSFPVNPGGFFASSILPNVPFNLAVQYFDSSASLSPLTFYSEISSSVSTNIIHISPVEDELDLSWTPSQYDVRSQPYSFVFRGGPGEIDLTYFLFVSGVDSNVCSSLISVPELPLNKNNVHVYPNPVHDNLQIEINRTSNDELVYSLSDVTGKIIYEKKSISNSNNINIISFSSGIYFLKIENNEGIFCKKILVY